jgi:membrane-bound lytic murein transglycosylase B
MYLVRALIPPLACLMLLGCGSKPTRDAPTADSSGFTTFGSDGRSVARRASSGGPRLDRGDYAGRADVERFIDRMERQGFSRAELVRVFSQVQRDPWILEYMERQWRPASRGPSGPSGAWTRYRAKHITSSNLNKGLAFWRRHEQTLNRAAERYGVPPEYIVAILGIETHWGGYMGKHRIVDALSTLAFDYPRRSAYFTDELEHFLIMARDEGFDPMRPVGSFAGAMGLGQFMPSSYHEYAVDFDNSGRRDLWDPEDAIGSVANYFASHGWQTGQPVTARASARGAVPRSMETGFKTNYRVGELKSSGIMPAAALKDGERVSLLRLDAAGGYEYWLGLKNFYVITRYNNSTYYAMTVHQLAQALRSQHGGRSPVRTAGIERAEPGDAS